MYEPLPRSFYSKNTLLVARNLLGKALVKGNSVGMIVETEAYIGTEDKACHASFRKKETCFPLWGDAGFTYIYMIYGMYYMLNISTEAEGFPAGVLIRALEPIQNIEGNTKGPGILTKTLKITKTLNNTDVTKIGELYITKYKDLTDKEVVHAKRVGVDYAGGYKDKPWRFFIKNNSFVSRQ